MNKADLAARLQEVCREQVLEDAPMSAYTTWRIGGPADIMAFPGSCKELAGVLSILTEAGIAPVTIGNGSNLLIGDKGIRGVVLKLSGEFAASSWRELQVTAGAAMLLGTVALEAAERGAAGLEFARGIPGSIGGAIRMNAGAYGHNLSDHVTAVTVMDNSGETRSIPKEELEFAYRDSSLFRMEGIVTDITLSLTAGDRDEIMAKMKEYQHKRGISQPLEYPSCGSVFRNPPNDHAGRLVELCGLRGLKVGGAMVSPKHGNFIINVGGATAADVRELMEQVQSGVYQYSGTELIPEVKFLGEF